MAVSDEAEFVALSVFGDGSTKDTVGATLLVTLADFVMILKGSIIETNGDEDVVPSGEAGTVGQPPDGGQEKAQHDDPRHLGPQLLEEALLPH